MVQNLKENWLVLLKMTWIWQTFVHRLKNSDFILESKMAELNKNKNSKQQDRPDALRNKWIAQWAKRFTHVLPAGSTESLFLSYKKISKKAVKLVSFLQCLVNISRTWWLL